MKRLSPKEPRALRVIKIQLMAVGGQEWRWFYLIELYDVAEVFFG